MYVGRRPPDLRLFSSSTDGEKKSGGLLKRIWNSWIPIPTGVGLTLLAVLQWRRLDKKRRQGEIAVAKDWEVTCYKAIPLRSFSRAFGWASEVHIPNPMRPYVYNSYARFFGVNLEEVSDKVDSFNCLGSFFTRKLKDGVRPIEPQKPIVSPADGKVLNLGKVNSCQIEQVKGVTYSIKAFLGDITWKSSSSNSVKDFNGNIIPQVKAERREESWPEYKRRLLHNPSNELYQCVVYLAPGDYHRFHSPVDWQVVYRRHFQGELLSVNPTIASWIPGLFTLNERAVYTGTWEHGYFSMTAVGATNVGSIRVYDDSSLHTNTRKWKDCRHKDKVINKFWRKGEEVGEFRMGSTIVLLFEAPPNFKFNFAPGSRVKVGKGL